MKTAHDKLFYAERKRAVAWLLIAVLYNLAVPLLAVWLVRYFGTAVMWGILLVWTVELFGKLLTAIKAKRCSL